MILGLCQVITGLFFLFLIDTIFLDTVFVLISPHARMSCSLVTGVLKLEFKNFVNVNINYSVKYIPIQDLIGPACVICLVLVRAF